MRYGYIATTARGRSPIGRGKALKPPPVRVRVPPPLRSSCPRNLATCDLRNHSHFRKIATSHLSIRRPSFVAFGAVLAFFSSVARVAKSATGKMVSRVGATGGGKAYKKSRPEIGRAHV